MTEATEVPGSGWSVAVIADEDEAWPLIAGKPSRSRSGQVRPTRMQPDLILLWIGADGTVTARGSGIRLRRDGTLGDPGGGMRVDAPWHSIEDVPPWARKLIWAALEESGMAEQIRENESR